MFKRSKPQTAQSQSQPPQKVPDEVGMGLRVYTFNYVITGRAMPGGALVGWLNILNKKVLVLHQAQVTSLSPDSPLRPAALPQVTLPKRQIIAIEVLDGQQIVRLEPRQVPVAIYTARFAIRAELRPPAAAPVEHFFNLLTGIFFPVTDARLHPMIPTRPLDNQQVKLLILNRERIDFYHTL